MPSEFHWNEDINGLPGILEVRTENLTAWDEYHAVIDRIITLLNETSLDRVDVIVTSIGKTPGGNPIPHLQRTYRDLAGREKLGLLLLVAENSNSLQNQLLQMVGQVVLKTAGVAMTNMRMIVSSHDEAVQLIRDDRANVNNSVWNAIRRR